MCRHAVFAMVWLVIPLPLAAADEETRADELTAAAPRFTLGMAVEELPNDGPHGGVIVRRVTAEGPAAKAGIRTGDIIIRVANRQVDDFDELIGVLAGHEAGDRLSVTVFRRGEPKRMKVTLGEASKEREKPQEGCQSCAYLGAITVPVESLTDELAERLGLEDEEGLVVLEVMSDSPAARAGLRHGDLIQSIDGEEIEDPDALRNHVHRTGVGKEVKLQVQRGGNTRQIVAKLVEGPCDVMLVTQRGPGDASATIERLEQRVEQLEKRLKELEGKRDPERTN